MDNELTQINLKNFDKIIKFRTLNRDHNFIFLKVKNSIQVYDPIKLNLLYSFYLNEIITNFEISALDSYLIISTKSHIGIYELVSKNLQDYDLKIKYVEKCVKNIENIMNISVSSLGDALAVLDRLGTIKILNKNLEILKTIKLDNPMLNNSLPLEFFNITYDTKNICFCKYSTMSVGLIYKNKNPIIKTLNDHHEMQIEYSEKIINFKDKILYLKEMQKDFKNYISYTNSSIFFMLTENFNFLILRKILEYDETKDEEIPDFIILANLDISTHTEFINFPFTSFSLLYGNENPVFKSNESGLGFENQNILETLGSGIISPELWYKYKNKNTLENEIGFFDLTSFHHTNISIDYLIFNFKENLILYKIQGLNSHPYNNLNIETIGKVPVDGNFSSNYLLLKMTKTLDKKYCLYFLDGYNLIRKFHFHSDIESGISDSEKYLKIYNNISSSEFNDKNRKTFILEYRDKDSLIFFLNSKLEISKVVVMKNIIIKNLKWIENSHFFVFSYQSAVGKLSKLGIINFFSKFFTMKINEVDEFVLHKQHISIDFAISLRDFNVSDIYDIKLESILTESQQKNLRTLQSQNEIVFDALIVSQENLILTEIYLEYNNSITYEQEYLAQIKLKISEEILFMELEEKLPEQIKPIFYENKIYYYCLETKSNIFYIKEIDTNKDKHTTIFQTLLLDELLYSNIFFNNNIIFISKDYINSYDVSTSSFYRVRNEYLQTKKTDLCIDLFKFGNFLFLIFISTSQITLVRVPKNKNKNEEYNIIFYYTFEVSLLSAKVSFRNNLLVINESQICRLLDVSKTKHNLQFDCDIKTLVLINSNPHSLFDMETFLDFFISNNEEIVKLILNIFCELHKNLDNFSEYYKNSKLIPNFFKLENIDYLKKIIFENDMNVLSIVGQGYGKKESWDSVNEESMISNAENEQDEKTINNISPRSHAEKLQYKRSKSIILANPKLKFKFEEDDQEKNPINISCKQNTNLIHIKNVYEVISQENTRNVDFFTKYFILKIMSKMDDLEKDTFKLSTADLCWISFINDQEYLLKFLSRDKTTTITWKFLKKFCIPLWIKNDYKLKELLELVGRNEYKLLLKAADFNDRNMAENVAFYFFLAGKKNVIIELFDKELHNSNVKKFLMRDFSVAKNRKIARENGDDLMNKKKYLFAAYFYLLADDVRSAIDMTLMKMKDVNLTICILRLYESPYDKTKNIYYTMDKIYQDYFINYGTVIRDPWLVIYGYLGQKKIDCALEYALNYDIHYNFEKNAEILESINEGYGDNIEIIRKIFAINVFDYKLLIFAKNLEKIYLKQLEEMKKNVKSVQNTNFEDMWGDEDDDTPTPVQTTTNSSSLKEIKLNYTNLAYLCLVNSLKRGVLYAPIINLYKLNRPNSELQLDNKNKELLKHLICDRVTLDSIFIHEMKNVELYFADIETFFDYLENNKILKQKELFIEINKVYIWLDNYKISAIPCFKSNKFADNLLNLTNFSEKLISRNLNILIDFNFSENLNLEKIDTVILKKIQEMANFIYKSLKLIESFDQKQLVQNKIMDNFDSKQRFQKTEQNLYIFRIIFSFYFYLLFLAKIVLSYHKCSVIFENLKVLVSEYRKLETFHIECYKHLDFVNRIATKLSHKIKKGLIGRDEYVLFYIQILNISLTITVRDFLFENLEINQKKFRSKNKFDNTTKEVFVNEQFKFIPLLVSFVNFYIDNFETSYDKYNKNYMNVNNIFEIHEELKMIYMKNLSQESNFYKYSLIPIKKLFRTPEKLKSFEHYFNLKNNIIKCISGICKYIKYEKPKGKKVEVDLTEDPSESLNSKYTKESVKIINQIFKNGIELANFGENQTVHQFALNNCDISNMSVSLLTNGHKKLNLLYNLLVRRRSDDYLKLTEPEPSNMEDLYKSASETDFRAQIDKQFYYRYNEILTIIQDEICKKKPSSIFESTSSLPPAFFNDFNSSLYLQDISTNNITNISYSNIITSHPLLPTYLTSNNRGIISAWSYSSDSKKSIDEFYIEKLTKENMNKIKTIKRLQFNNYGHEFLTIDDVGNLYVFAYDYGKQVKLPKITLWNTNSKSCKDAIFLNNSGVIATTFKKDTLHHTTLWDFLLPINQANCGEIEIGGNLTKTIASDSTILICNDKPGFISFVDIRRFSEVSSFQAHLDEIKSIKISERENFMITSGKDGFVKIWDLSQKNTPLLIESFQPFTALKENHKRHFHLELANGMLFASRDNSIKLLRNKIY